MILQRKFLNFTIILLASLCIFESFSEITENSTTSSLDFGSETYKLLESNWTYLHTTLGDRGLFVFFYFSLITLYVALAGVFGLFDYFDLFPNYKIQYLKKASTKDYKHVLKNLFINYVGLIFTMGVITVPYARNAGMKMEAPLPSWKVFTGQMLIFLILEDLIHYILHRILHTPWLYQNIHKEHHLYSSPFGLAASYAHPAEVMILGFATFAPTLLVRPHFFTFYLWVIFRQLDAVLTHSGYDFPTPFDVLPTYGGTSFHDFHHKAFKWNYASRFTLFDKLGGTYREPPAIVNNKIKSN